MKTYLIRTVDIGLFLFEDRLYSLGVTSLHTLQLWRHRLIQQINRVLESLVLHERRIGLFCSLDRRMAKQMLNVSDSSTSAQ